MDKGDKIKFFTNSWLPYLGPIRTHVWGALKKDEEHISILALCNNGEWNLNGLSITLPIEILNMILDYPIMNNTNREDRKNWEYDPNGRFILSSAYNLITNQRLTITPLPNKVFRKIWQAKVPNKIKIFLWTLLYDRLPTSHSLHFKGLNIEPHCTHCNQQVEDFTHIFFRCPIAKTFLGISAGA